MYGTATEIIMRKISMNFKTNTNIVRTNKRIKNTEKKIEFKFRCNNELLSEN